MTIPAKTAHAPLDEQTVILRFLNSLAEPFPITAEIFNDLLTDEYAELAAQQKEEQP